MCSVPFFLSATLDVSFLEPGCRDFDELNDSCMILIAPFDLFSHGLYRYTFEGQCKEVPRLALRDGASRVFINTFGVNRQDFSQEFLDFMEYINNARDMVATRSKSARVRLIHSKVQKNRRSEKCGVKYVQRWEEIVYARQDAIYQELISRGCEKSLPCAS